MQHVGNVRTGLTVRPHKRFTMSIAVEKENETGATLRNFRYRTVARANRRESTYAVVRALGCMLLAQSILRSLTLSSHLSILVTKMHTESYQPYCRTRLQTFLFPYMSLTFHKAASIPSDKADLDYKRLRWVVD